ncbi:MAG: S1C family serine protease [Trueperaceae bacterium]
MNDFTASIETINSSVVQVHGRRGYPLSGVAWSDTTIITTNRATERDEDIQVQLSDGTTHPATLIGRDPRTDLAALKVTEKLKAATWQSTEKLKVGQWLLRVARPNGIRTTHGILGYVGDAWHTMTGGKIDEAIYTDAPTFTGFSGGAVVTTSGEVIGISSAALNQSGNAVIPTSTIKRVVEALLEHGYVKRGYLGISTQPVKLPETLGLEQHRALMIIAVEENSPAAKAGLVLGDTLIHFDGQAVDHPTTLASNLNTGQNTKVKILRGGQLHDMQITVGER